MRTLLNAHRICVHPSPRYDSLVRKLTSSSQVRNSPPSAGRKATTLRMPITIGSSRRTREEPIDPGGTGARAGRCAPGRPASRSRDPSPRSEEHTSELQSHVNLVCRLLLEKKKKKARLTSPKHRLVQIYCD